MKNIIALALLAVVVENVAAITIDESKFFAYTMDYRGNHVMLSKKKCHLPGNKNMQYAEKVSPQTGSRWSACWRHEQGAGVLVCEERDSELVGCMSLAKERFRDVASLPKSAF